MAILFNKVSGQTRKVLIRNLPASNSVQMGDWGSLRPARSLKTLLRERRLRLPSVLPDKCVFVPE
jgi:hypothetical protein